MSAQFSRRRQLEKLLLRPSQEVAPDCRIGGLTKRAFGTIPNCSSPLSNLNRLLRVSLLIAQCAVAPFGANLEARVPSHSAILIYANCKQSESVAGVENLRLGLHRQSAVERKRIASASKTLLHVLLHIHIVRRRVALVVAAVAAHTSCVAAGGSGVCRIAI